MPDDLYDGTTPILSADGVRHEFERGTPMATIDKVMKSYAEEHRDKSTFLQQAAHGFADPLIGRAQLESRRVDPEMDYATRYGGADPEQIRSAGIQGIDKFVQEREQGIQQERGYSKNLNWGRMTGDALNPINYVGPGAMGGAGKLANLAKTVVGGALGGAMQPVEDSSNFGTKKAEQTGIGGLTGLGLGGLGAVASAGTEAVGRFVARNWPENLTADAATKLLRRFAWDEKAGGTSAKDALDLVENASQPMSIADVGSKSVKGLAGKVARTPDTGGSIATKFLTDRDDGAAKRLAGYISKYVFSGQSALKATEALQETRAAAAKPTYDAAYGLKDIWSPGLQRFIDFPIVKKALDRGYQLESIHALARGEPLTASQLGVDVAVDGTVTPLGHPNMRVLDIAKQGLDALIDDQIDSTTGRMTRDGAALVELKNAYLKEIDSLDKQGLYKKARETWGGISSSMGAIKLGRNVFNQSGEANEAIFSKLSKSDQEFYRLGLADVLRERLGKAGFGASTDESKQLLKSPWMKEQLRTAFKSKDDFDGFINSVLSESKMFATKQGALGGSQTSERLVEEGFDEPATFEKIAKIAASAATGHLFRSARDTWRFFRDMDLKASPEVNEKLAQVIFSSPLPKDNPIVEALRIGRAPPRINPASKAANEISTGSVGAGTGASSALSEELVR